jgi:dynein heavy chain
MLQECNKIVIEPMKGLRQNLSKIISSAPDSTFEQVEEGCPAFTDLHKKLFFVISFFHAIMNER